MNSLKIFCFIALVLATTNASPKHGQNKDNAYSLKPTDWLSTTELESMPSVEDITLQQLENMSMEDAERKIEKIYHLSQINHALEPSFVPSPSNVPVILMKPNGQPERTNLNELVQTAKQQPNFGDEEVTIFITGLPQSSPSVAKANKKLIQAYMQRYNGQRQPISNNQDYDYGNNKDNQGATSSEEDYSESWKNPKPTNGNFVIISLGSTLTNMKRLALIDVEQTGNMIGKALVELTNECDVPQEIIHIVGQGVGAQVAGAAGRQYKRLTGHQLRRITALDPAKMFANEKYLLSGLARGDADFVDAIHTSTCGMGTRQRVGDVDFYVNGPASTAPGATNVIEATMRATRYFAESVRPGNERNFPAVAANSMDQYENNDGSGKRAYMGIATDFDLEGDYILTVNPKSPFGKSTPAQKQSTYHAQHQSWKSAKNQNHN